MSMMSWSAENNFLLSLTLQDGTVGITYPFNQRYDPVDLQHNTSDENIHLF